MSQAQSQGSCPAGDTPPRSRDGAAATRHCVPRALVLLDLLLLAVALYLLASSVYAISPTAPLRRIPVAPDSRASNGGAAAVATPITIEVQGSDEPTALVVNSVRIPLADDRAWQERIWILARHQSRVLVDFRAEESMPFAKVAGVLRLVSELASSGGCQVEVRLGSANAGTRQ